MTVRIQQCHHLEDLEITLVSLVTYRLYKCNLTVCAGVYSGVQSPSSIEL